ncbi:MAG: 8-amino-7-oxononanoate synthase [Candidatus Omnitrophica bacterium CG12_big_fil_rev_8_21_14_0_65_50_5]|nr:MAG: 8-amino-7-oxononanoate synthase [Candidatus Omnitrophica bacterium CG12_big_fil_rev_8_21_14_0_65_50_5]
MLDNFLQTELNDLQSRHLYRLLRNVDGAQGPRVRIEGREILNFSSNDYLGLASDPRLAQAAKEALEKEGAGAGASRLISGHLSSHRKLEQLLADFKGTQSALVFSTGYMANVGIISALAGRDGIVFSDRLNHASIVDGIVLSRAEMKRYPHGGMKALEEMLKETPAGKKKLIVTDSVFSMDGDIAPLDAIADLAQRYGAMVMVDEAHGFGVLGKNGKGAVEHFGLEGKIDIQMGTLSKAAGCFGGYICGCETLREYLINKARSFIYTTAMPPMAAAASARGVEIIRDEPARRTYLLELANDLRRGLNDLGFDTMNSQTPIIPILVKDAKTAVELSGALFEEGIWAQAIRPPTVPQNTARLRLTVTAAHTKDDIERLLEAISKLIYSVPLTKLSSQRKLGPSGLCG